MDLVRRLDHTSIALEHIPLALPLFQDLLGGELVGGADEGSFRWVQLRFPGGAKIELIDPSPGDNFLRRFLDQHGPGMHHITFKVPDLAAAVEAVRRAGYEVIGENHDAPDWKEAFIHPRSAHGVLIQLAETPYDEGEPGSPIQGEHARALLGSGAPPPAAAAAGIAPHDAASGGAAPWPTPPVEQHRGG